MGQSFAQKFAGLRHRAGLSQRQAAAELNISQALLSHYENGLREPRLEFVVKACEYYGVTADYMLGRFDECTDDTACLLEAADDMVIQLGQRYGRAAAESAACYLNMALYKFAVCTDMAEGVECSAAMALAEREMLEIRGGGTYNAKWMEKKHPKEYEKITVKIKSVKNKVV